MPIISLSALKTLLGVSGTDNDQVLTNLERRATAVFEAAAGRKFTAVTNEVVRLSGGAYLSVDRTPISNVEVRDTLETADPETGIYVDASRGLIWKNDRRDGWAYEPGRWLVTYDGGYAADAAPDDVQDAVLMIVQQTFESNATPGMQSERDGDYSYVRAAGPVSLPPEAHEIAIQYRTWA